MISTRPFPFADLISFFLALHSSLINPDPADPSISSGAGKSLCARRENGLLAGNSRQHRRRVSDIARSALSFVNARRYLLTYFHSAVLPPFATVTFIITRPIINHAFASFHFVCLDTSRCVASKFCQTLRCIKYIYTQRFI